MRPLNLAERVSPNKVLHQLVSHKLQEEHDQLKLINNNKEDAESAAIDMKLQQMCVEAGLSPKSQSKVPRKGRKQNPEVQQAGRQIQKYRRKLGMPYAGSNCNGKIWFFVQHNVDVEILLDTEQSITVKLQFQDYSKDMVVTMVYAKCSEVERLQLWDNLYLLASNMTSPWLVGGDFNVLLNEEEKIGGQLVLPQEYEDFAFCLNSCELHEIPFKGSPFTWWNGRAANDCIFKRLDRMLYNDIFQNWFGQLEVEHLSRTGSDHAPLLVSCGDQVQKFIKPFRFLKFWVEHDNFLDFVKQQWDTVLTDDAFLSFKLKMKKLKTALSPWSKTTFGDIFKQLVIREEIVKIKEQLFEENPSEENRMVMQRAHAELKLYLHYEEEFWRQKARMDYFSEGDKNTRYFHSLQFTHEEVSEDSPILNNIQELIREEDNILLAEQPTMEEVQKVVFELNGDSACGPDGFSGIFYQKCWEVIKADVYSVVKAFFEGQTLPKSITHTHLVLLPKKNVVDTFSDMRPISLNNFINKVISRVVHDRLDKLLTRVISSNQSGFVKGRNIIENVLLTQEIVTDIRKRGKPANVVIKLDMAKAYDRAHGFFHSTRDVKQGDPLSPALFIIAAEVLSRALNSLFDQSSFVGYGMPKWSVDVNHPAYADDTIIFSSADSQSLQMIMDILQEYEKVSGQMINKRKSSFYLFSKVSQELSEQVETITGFVRGHFPFTYHGVPITHARKRKVDYTELLKKIKYRLQTWKGKLLSYGGKAVMITSVLQSIPIHVLSAIRPPKCVVWVSGLSMTHPKLYVLNSGGSLEPLALFGLISCGINTSWQINEQVEDVSELMTDGKWNISKLMQLFPEDIVQHIIQEIDIKYTSNEWDRPWWMMTSTGKFTVSSAWQLLRQKANFPGMNIPTIWHQMVQFFAGYKPTVICRIIEWRKPAPGICKCNTDGAAKGNPSPSFVAFCIRNEKGDLVYAAAKTLADGTNIVAEAEAIRMGLRHCVVKQLFPVIIETDSMTMKMILNDEWKVPWSISMLVDDIKRMMVDHTVSVEHIHRDGNGLADFFTNFVFGFAGSVQFHNFQELPSQAKRILNLEKRGIPNLRIRTIQDKAPD
ncbi:uncharacterized protein LOC132637573 [Lycium barbarum]|uniref:uncharacterized protein LOC132637573 n=1 Tax=Lycium barbarum TaxID=112863 RepID=UPI00293E5227|nr:uncharacterized protein LOC132637573 [Lycium barbarum]